MEMKDCFVTAENISWPENGVSGKGRGYYLLREENEQGNYLGGRTKVEYGAIAIGIMQKPLGLE